MAKARTIENIEEGKPEVDKALMRAPNNLHVHDKPTNGCCAETMDHAKEQDKKDATFSTNANHAKEHQLQPIELTDTNPPPRTFGASLAAEAEETIAKEGRHPVRSTPVTVPKRAWCPKTQVATWTGSLRNMEKWESKIKASCHQETIQCSTTLKHMPKKLMTTFIGTSDAVELRAIIEKFFDAFAQEGMQNHIRGFQFNINAGQAKPICCKQPQHGPHESQVIAALAEQLQKKGMIDNDHGPWGSPVTLASKSDQAYAHWSKFTFRLCINCQNLNAITRPFTVPIT
jgi:hypothetical protein